MSRVAKYPVALLKGVEVTLGTTEVSVKGPLGTLKQAMLPFVSVEKDGDNLQVKAGEGDSANAMSGTMRALLANMVSGVTKGFERKLTLVGVGYKAQAQGSKLPIQALVDKVTMWFVPAVFGVAAL